MENTKQKRIKSCAKCGKEFECSHDADCWCNDYAISNENLQYLKENYPDCLCPDCLAVYAENKTENIDN